MEGEGGEGPRLNAWANAIQITWCSFFRSKIDAETRILCRSSNYPKFVPVNLCARYLLIEGELGDGEDMDRYAILARNVHTESTHFFGLSFRLQYQ